MEDGKCGTPKGCDGRGGWDTLLGISTYDCPGGVHRSAKQSSPGLDPSRALRALFSTPPLRKGVTYRDTRESTEGLDISRRSVVAAWFRARFTARERTTYGIPVEVRCSSPFLLLLSLSPSLPLVCVYVCLPPSRSPTIFFSYKGKQISRRRGFTARGIRTTLVRLRALLPVTRRIPSLFPLLSAESRACRDIFLEAD